MRTEEIDHEKLNNIRTSILLKNFANECRCALDDPKRCMLLPVYEKHVRELDRGDKMITHMCDVDRLGRYETAHLNEKQKKWLEHIISRYSSVKWHNGDYRQLTELRKSALDLAADIINMNKIEIETTVFISPCMNYKEHPEIFCYSVYHNTRLCSLQPLGWNAIIMQPNIKPTINTGYDYFDEFGYEGITRPVKYVYSKQFEDAYAKAIRDENGKIIPLDMHKIDTFEKMCVDGSDFRDLGDHPAYVPYSVLKLFENESGPAV